MDYLLEHWDDILSIVKSEHDITDVSFKTWLKPLTIHSISGNTLRILVPTDQMGSMAVDYISKKYYFPLKVAIAEFTGNEYEIEFLLPEQAQELELSEAQSKNNTAADPSRTEEKEKTVRPARIGLDPRYTFDTFVVGNNNKFAHAAALAVAESPGNVYNPLFIYGDAGLGKTHLMHSIAHFILDRSPEKKVLYVTSETFTNELIDSIRNGNNTAMTKFREKYRSLDVLLIDDIQFIIGKESTQEEFFHTFNELYGNKKQIIISSDKPPKDIETLESRLRSRFEWGLIADISSPDFETRMAILHRKEQNDGYNIDKQVIEYIAMNIKSNIRELEGALNKVVAESRLGEGQEINIELAQKALRDIISPDAHREITCSYIIGIVADHFHLTVKDINGNKRSSNISFPRQIAMYLCNTMTDIGSKQIGQEMGGKDHSTVIHGVRRITEELERNDSLKKTIDLLKKKIDPAS